LDLPEDAFPAGVTPFHVHFMWLLDWVPIRRFVDSPPLGPGHPQHDRRALLRAFLAKALGNMPTTEALIDRLHADPTLRRLCGWQTRKSIPSASTFSRAFASFAQWQVLDQIHAWLVKEHAAPLLIWHVSRDSTAIPARERAHKPDPPAPAPTEKKKRGRPRKGEPPRKKEPTRIERQFNSSEAETDALLAELPDRCAVASKQNSKGKLEHWRGYKLHADVADDGLPLFCFTTSASVHDSQAAIPMARKTAARVTSLYDLMDAAYDVKEIKETSRLLGHVPIIDHQPGRKGKEAKVEMTPDRARRFNTRTTVERFNSMLKESYGGRTVRVRGRRKVHAHLMTGVVVIFAQILHGWAARDGPELPTSPTTA
jgi:hypothetical protein